MSDAPQPQPQPQGIRIDSRIVIGVLCTILGSGGTGIVGQLLGHPQGQPAAPIVSLADLADGLKEVTQGVKDVAQGVKDVKESLADVKRECANAAD